MGQKVNPKACRLGYIVNWDSRWFPTREAPRLLEEDYKIRRYVKQRLKLAAISRIVVERAGSFLRVVLHTARPGMVIGRRGADIENLKTAIEGMTSKKTFVNVVEVKNPEMDAMLVAESIGMQLEKRIHHRRAIKRAIERAMGQGAGGIKIAVSGRLGGAEIARYEWLKEGRVPTSTLRADVDYGYAEAHMSYGKIGIKTWIFKKEYFTKTREDLVSELKKEKAAEEGGDAGIPLGGIGMQPPSEPRKSGGEA